MVKIEHIPKNSKSMWMTYLLDNCYGDNSSIIKKHINHKKDKISYNHCLINGCKCEEFI